MTLNTFFTNCNITEISAQTSYMAKSFERVVTLLTMKEDTRVAICYMLSLYYLSRAIDTPLLTSLLSIIMKVVKYLKL